MLIRWVHIRICKYRIRQGSLWYFRSWPLGLITSRKVEGRKMLMPHLLGSAIYSLMRWGLGNCWWQDFPCDWEVLCVPSSHAGGWEMSETREANRHSAWLPEGQSFRNGPDWRLPTVRYIPGAYKRKYYQHFFIWLSASLTSHPLLCTSTLAFLQG